MMTRTLEPELMDDHAQAEAYAAADFSEADALMLQSFNDSFPDSELEGPVLDLGCGPGNITFRFAEQFPRCQLIGIDGSDAMLSIANKRKASKPAQKNRIRFIRGIVPHIAIPNEPYSAIVSNSFLHHLHHPAILWELINRHAQPGCKILIMDLFRPASPRQAQALVDLYAASEPEVLKRDFYNSLLAALTPDEVKQQLLAAELTELAVHEVSDRHMVIAGEKS